MLNDRKIKLGLSMRYLDYHVAAWRHPAVPADGAVHFDLRENLGLKRVVFGA